MGLESSLMKDADGNDIDADEHDIDDDDNNDWV